MTSLIKTYRIVGTYFSLPQESLLTSFLLIRNSNHLREIKKVFGKLQMNRPSVVFSDMTIVFDIGDFRMD